MQKKMPEPIERIPEEEELVHALRFLFRDPKLCTSKALHQALKDRYPGWIVNQRRVKKIVRNFSCRGDESIEDDHKGWDDETHEYWDKSSWTFVPEEEREEEEEEEGFVLVHRVTV